MQNLKEKQDKELAIRLITKTVDGGFQLVGYEEAEENLRQFLDKARKETIECVCDRIIGRISGLRKEDTGDAGETMWNNGYNNRIKEEKEIKKEIIDEILNSSI